LAIDDRGNIFVADTGNCKLKKFDFQGKLLASAGSEGKGPGQFKEPTGLKIDQEGKIYILDAEKHTLQVFAPEPDASKPLPSASPPASVALHKEFPGEVTALVSNKKVWGLGGDSLFILGAVDAKKIGVRGKKPGMFRDPRGVAVDASGNLWVADTGNDRIQKFSMEGEPLQVIGEAGSDEGEFDSPAAAAVSPKGNIVVADTDNQRIQVFSPKGQFLGAFGKAGSQKGQLKEPVGVAVDGAENIYVVDRQNNRIGKFDSAGTLLWEVGKAGEQDGEFSGPESILLSPDGEVYVLDAGNARVQVFDTNGKFLRKFGNEGKGPGEFRSPAGLALEAGVFLYVGDRGNKRTQVLTLRHTPAVPVEVAAQPRMNEVHLSWKPNAETYLMRYNIYRSEAPSGPFALLAIRDEPSYVDRGLPSNRTFHYCITSQAREGNESAPSAPIPALTPKLVPSPPKKIRVEASEKQITLSWLPNLEPFVSHYQIYRTRQMSAGFELVAKVERTIFVDAPLADEVLYYYQITAMGKEGDESQPSEVLFTSTPKASLTAAPIDIAKIELREIFASAYKYYESHPLGSVVLRNNTDIPFPSAKLAFSIKDYMDFPTEVAVPEIAPKQQVEVAIKPVFNNRILEVTENTPLQSEIALTFYVSGAAKIVTRTFPVTLFERHAMTWDPKAKVGAFVTPKDPPVADFARSVIQPYVDAYPNLPASIVYGRTIFAALGVYGLSYIVDPTSPFREFSEKAAAVDYVQYPCDTLNRKSGDCDDLSIVYAAALENIGIGTALVDVPGHVFVMFNTGIPESERDSLGFAASLLVVFRGTVWIPVELTMVGQSFTHAWQKGAEEHRDWSAKGKVDIIEVQKAWEQFRPVTLPPVAGKQIRVDKNAIEAKFKGELDALGKQRLTNLSANYLAVLEKTPKDLQTLAQLGILYGENGLYNAALEQFQKMLTVDSSNPIALNNIGNIYFLLERLEDARRAYESSLRTVPDDAGVMVNLARVSLRAGRKEEAKRWLRNAAAIDPRVLRRYGDLAADLGIAK
jgi:DNA-binding beta-propeller fold protein YncE